MSEQIEKIVKEIKGKIGEDDFIESATDGCNRLYEIDKIGASIDSLLLLMETHQNADFGTPGPIVHFLEKFYKNGYEQKLFNSIKRKPTMHTLWMLNRLIDGADEECLKKSIENLELIMNRNDVDEKFIQLAKEFRNMH